MGLTLAAINRPVWVIMLMLLALTLGWIGISNIPVEENPDVNFPYITVQTVYFGASPEEIESEITKEIEDACSGLARLQQITSVSLEGVSVVSLEFTLGTSLDVALADTTAKINEIAGLLPAAAERPVVSKLNITGEPILYLAAESDVLSPLELRDLIDDRVKDALARIPGVAEVSVQGGETREIRVAVDKQKLLSLGVGITNVLNALQGANVNVPGGSITQGNKETGVRVQGELKTVEEIRNLAVPISDNMNPDTPPAIIQLRDIATIIDGPAERTIISRVNGRDSVLITLQKTREGNTVEIADNAKQVLKQLEATYPIQFTITQDSSKRVLESIEDLQLALIIGIFLVVCIIYLFLHNFRGMLIVSFAIPTCLFAAFAVISAVGYTLNVMTMLGLSLAVGILVDDAIVVLENTYRHLSMGEPPKQAALNGRMEIGLAAVSITLIDVAVFIPIAFMGGITGEFMRPFAVTVAVATLFSLFVSFTLTPMLASRWYRDGENLEDKHGFAKWFDKRLHNFAKGYQRLLDNALKHRYLVFFGGFAFLIGVFMMIGGGYAKSLAAAIETGMSAGIFFFILFAIVFLISLFLRKFNFRILLGGAAFAGVILLFTVIGFALSQLKGAPIFNATFFPPVETGQIAINVTMPPGSSLDRTLKVVERIEQSITPVKDIKFVTSSIGVGAVTGFAGRSTGSQYAQVAVTLKDKKALLDALMPWHATEELRTRSQDSIKAEIQQKIGKIPDAQIVVAGVTGFGGGQAPIQVAITSLNPDKVVPAAVKAQQIISNIPGIINVELSTKPGKPEILLKPDRWKLADNDLTVSQIGAVTRVFYEGNTDSKFRDKGREYNIRVNLEDSVRKDTARVGSVPVAFRQGRPVYLGDVTTINPGLSPDKIERVDRQRQVTVLGFLLPGYIVGTVDREVKDALQKENLGEGVEFVQLGEAQVQARESVYLVTAFALALIFVYFVLASLFDNILYPFIIQLAQPQALVGALLALMIADKPFDIVGFIAIIMLVGLVGKNAILLVDYANTLRARGYDRHDALLESGATRMRPILMTTLALVLAMIPIALSLGRGSEFRAPLGIIIIGGMSLSTILTLFVIPCSYTLFDDLSKTTVGRVEKILNFFFKKNGTQTPKNSSSDGQENSG